MEQNLEPKVLDKMITLSGFIFLDYARDCAIEAFNEGRQSVIDNIPNLEWNGCVRRTDQICAFSKTQFGTYSIIKHHFTCLFYWYFEDEILHGGALTLEECKLLANEDYKKRIKKALGVCE